jgi:hypothetical protein
MAFDASRTKPSSICASHFGQVSMTRAVKIQSSVKSWNAGACRDTTARVLFQWVMSGFLEPRQRRKLSDNFDGTWPSPWLIFSNPRRRRVNNGGSCEGF